MSGGLNFLQRYTEAVQNQSFPITEARLISAASPPLKRSDPNTALVLVITSAGGLVLGFGFAYLRELADNVVRTSRQVEEILRTRNIVVVPYVKTPKKKAARLSMSASAPGAAANNIAAIASTDPLLSNVIDHPFSRFAESMRLLKVFADGKRKSDRVIAVTAITKGNGKSTIAANFARLVAHAGGRAILIDADLRNPSLSRALAPDAVHGIVDVVSGKATLLEVVPGMKTRESRPWDR
jgi:succinoglycan biosynthesis transport protein ExoP